MTLSEEQVEKLVNTGLEENVHIGAHRYHCQSRCKGHRCTRSITCALQHISFRTQVFPLLRISLYRPGLCWMLSDSSRCNIVRRCWRRCSLLTPVARWQALWGASTSWRRQAEPGVATMASCVDTLGSDLTTCILCTRVSLLIILTS